MSDQQGKARTSVAGNVWASGGTAEGRDDLYRAGSPGPSLPLPPDVDTGEQTRVQPAASGHAPAAPAQPARPGAVSAGPRSVSRRTRKARLRLSRIDPWSVMKTSFLFSIAFGIMFWFATYVVWSVIGASGLFDAMNDILQTMLQNPNDQTQIRIEDFVNTNRVLGVAALIAVINVVLLTAIGTLTAFLYNLSANILGGLELTLAED